MKERKNESEERKKAILCTEKKIKKKKGDISAQKKFTIAFSCCAQNLCVHVLVHKNLKPALKKCKH